MKIIPLQFKRGGISFLRNGSKITAFQANGRRKYHSFVFLSFTISSCLSLGIDMYWWNSIE